MASQYGTTRVYSTPAEKDSSAKVMCPNCKVNVVPKGINDTRNVGTKQEKHCPNCGHIMGRANH